MGVCFAEGTTQFRLRGSIGPETPGDGGETGVYQSGQQLCSSPEEYNHLPWNRGR